MYMYVHMYVCLCTYVHVHVHVWYKDYIRCIGLYTNHKSNYLKYTSSCFNYVVHKLGINLSC